MSCEIDHWIGHWVRKLNRNIVNLHDQKLMRFGVTASQVGVLAQLWKKDGLTQKELVRNLSIRPASLTGLVDSLLEKGYVSRKSDESDARSKRIYLTDKGRELEGISLSIIEEMEALLSKGFSEEEKQLLLCWLNKLYRNLEN